MSRRKYRFNLLAEIQWLVNDPKQLYVSNFEALILLLS